MSSDNLMDYCKSSAELSVPVRYEYCPLHKGSVGRKGFVVTRTRNGFVMYCHSCGRNRFVGNSSGKPYTPPRSVVVERVRKLTTAPEHMDKKQEYVYIPSDTTNEIPFDALIWLQQYNVTDEEIAKYNIGWSNAYSRLILPVYKDDVLVYWQGRYFGDDPSNYKYLNIKSSKEDIMFLTDVENDSDTIVIVEDIISAIAVERMGFRALALLGSHLPNYIIEYVIAQVSLGKLQQAVVWLDSDKKSKSIIYSNRLNTFGIPSTWVSTALDPKCYTPDELRVHLGVEEATVVDDSAE